MRVKQLSRRGRQLCVSGKNLKRKEIRLRRRCCEGIGAFESSNFRVLDGFD